jgi:hypothetical protein
VDQEPVEFFFPVLLVVVVVVVYFLISFNCTIFAT